MNCNAEKDLGVQQLVALSGAHTIGEQELVHQNLWDSTNRALQQSNICLHRQDSKRCIDCSWVISLLVHCGAEKGLEVQQQVALL
jgi:hypothetical protein